MALLCFTRTSFILLSGFSISLASFRHASNVLSRHGFTSSVTARQRFQLEATTWFVVSTTPVRLRLHRFRSTYRLRSGCCPHTAGQTSVNTRSRLECDRCVHVCPAVSVVTGVDSRTVLAGHGYSNPYQGLLQGRDASQPEKVCRQQSNNVVRSQPQRYCQRASHRRRLESVASGSGSHGSRRSRSCRSPVSYWYCSVSAGTTSNRSSVIA
ncbi:hypothetical protein SAMN05443661_10289 [Natronobacterium gregoryi]|uniref:Uncharacterized protein n=2 Tax=Natronobacterium gregoryi TaxID=44930 RepID=L0AJF8_NATGS|nr:hypothetical protein Natgr_1992 [Natronobacterium gregoryi SP2]SFI59464.1 hypothetical protein SAMN05443661_10289 [Natronobacterium gregoryi]